MESEPTKHTTIIIFGGILLAAVVVALVMYFLPSDSGDTTQELPQLATVTEQSQPTNFNTAVLERKEYKDLDASLFVRGLLPVTPPTGTGKTNVFR